MLIDDDLIGLSQPIRQRLDGRKNLPEVFHRTLNQNKVGNHQKFHSRHKLSSLLNFHCDQGRLDQYRGHHRVPSHSQEKRKVKVALLLKYLSVWQFQDC